MNSLIGGTVAAAEVVCACCCRCCTSVLSVHVVLSQSEGSSSNIVTIGCDVAFDEKCGCKLNDPLQI